MNRTIPSLMISCFVCALMLPSAGAAVSRQDGDQRASERFPKDIIEQALQQVQLEIPPEFRVPRKDGDWVEQESFDLDGDGAADLAVEWTTGRGPLSTYYSAFRIAARGNAKVLKGGAPLEPGTEISMLDLLTPVPHAPLCSVGGSLRFPDRSFEDFSGGPWWGKENQALAVAMVSGYITSGDVVKLGYARLTVTKKGQITLEGKHLVTLTPAKITVTDSLE